jgi:RyR domain
VFATAGSTVDSVWTVEREGIVDPVRDGSAEPIAQAIHERWRSEQIGAGKAAPSWGELDESRKQSSRDQARDIPVKLRMVGCDIAPLRERAAKDFTFTDEEVETLAEAEHVRWMRDRIADGWTAGDKDVTRKTTPYLVAFKELAADIAEFDRIFVREIPRLLASVGLQVVRTATTPKQTGGAQPA